jgi:O-antigen/teichoic acid export membrane protein
MPRPQPARPGTDRRTAGGLGRDLAVTGASQLIVALGGLVLYRQLAAQKGIDGFADYALIKQAVILVVPLALVGLGPALPRSIAARDAGRGDRTAETYLLGALAVASLASGVVIALALAAPEATASLLFGGTGGQSLVDPFAATLASTVLFRLAYGYFRGRGRFVLGSVIEALGVAIAPVLIVAVRPAAPIEHLVVAMAAVLASLSLAATVPAALRGVPAGLARLRAAATTLVQYGSRRVPGDLAYVVLFASAPALIARAGSAEDVAYFSAAQQIVGLLTIAGLPIGLVALPRVAELWNTDRAAARGVTVAVVQVGIAAGVFITVQLLAFGDVAARAWLGAAFAGSGPVIRTVSAATGVYLLYVLLRSPIDAVAVRAYNTRNTLVAVTIFALVAGAGRASGLGPGVITLAFSVGLVVLGILSLVTTGRLFDIRPRQLQLGLCVLAILPVAAITVLVRREIDLETADLITLLEIVVLEPFLLALYLLALHLSGARLPRLPLRRRLVLEDPGGDEAEAEREEE